MARVFAETEGGERQEEEKMKRGSDGESQRVREAERGGRERGRVG